MSQKKNSESLPIFKFEEDKQGTNNPNYDYKIGPHESRFFQGSNSSELPFDANLIDIFEENGWDVNLDFGESSIDLDKEIETLINLKMKKQNPNRSKIEKKNEKKSYHNTLCDLLINKFNYKDVEKKPLGEGSFGVVYKVLNKDWLEVALKVQYSLLSNLKDQNLESLLNEKKSLNMNENFKANRTINCWIFFSGKYYVSFIETEIGTSLAHLIQKKINNGIAFTQEEKTKICCDLIENLFFLHSENKAHLDIKPGNIIYYDQFQKYRFIDFGTMENFKTKPISGSLYSEYLNFRGTKFYASPLMMESLHSNMKICQDPFSSDIFSLGVTLLEIHMVPEKMTKESLAKLCENGENFPSLVITPLDFDELKNALILAKMEDSEKRKYYENSKRLQDSFYELILGYKKYSLNEKKHKEKKSSQHLKFREFNLLEFLLPKHEKDRLNIFEIALALNMRHCFLLEHLKKGNDPHNFNINEKILFPSACLTVKYYEGENIFANFSEKGYIHFVNETQIKLGEYLDSLLIQQKYYNYKLVKINESLPILDENLMNGVYLVHKCYDMENNKFFKIDEYKSGIKILFYEGSYEKFTEKYFKDLLLTFPNFLKEKFKLRLIPKINISKLAENPIGYNIYHKLRSYHLRLYDKRDKNSNKKSHKLKIIFYPKNGENFIEILTLSKVICILSHLLIKYCKNLKIIDVPEDEVFQLPSISIYVLGLISRFKRENKEFEVAFFWNKYFGYSFENGWKKNYLHAKQGL